MDGGGAALVEVEDVDADAAADAGPWFAVVDLPPPAGVVTAVRSLS